MCAVAPAHAEDEDQDGDEDASVSRPAPSQPSPLQRYGLVLLENAVIIAVPGVWYWSDVDFNRMDWELKWDWPSWKTKLFTTDALRFDTNAFYTNAVRHPIAGVLHYQVGRANGFGMVGSVVINMLSAMVWEYVVEYPEYVSVNDLVMNVAAGVSVGEPLLQVGRFGRNNRTGPTGRTLASSLTPVDTLHAWFGADEPAHAPGWHRLELAGGMASTRFGDEPAREEGSLSIDVDLVTHPDYQRDGAGTSFAPPGSWNRIALDLRFADSPGSSVPGVRFQSQTLLAGRFTRRVVDRGGPRGSGLLLGLGSAFLYDRRRLVEDTDRLAVAHLVGPRLEVALYRGPVTVRWEAAGHGDFAMVQAHVFGTMPLNPDPPLTSALRAEGYYYAAGLSAASRLRLMSPAADAELEVRGYQFWSIDGLDRQELGDGRADPHGVVDQRLFGRMLFQVRPQGGSFTLGTQLEGTLRRGVWRDFDRRTSELSASLRLGWAF